MSSTINSHDRVARIRILNQILVAATWIIALLLIGTIYSIFRIQMDDSLGFDNSLKTTYIATLSVLFYLWTILGSATSLYILAMGSWGQRATVAIPATAIAFHAAAFLQSVLN